MRHLLHVKTPSAEASFELGASVVIGRSEGADIRIGLGSLGIARIVSRRHAQLQVLGRVVTITDLHSTNGVTVDGERLAPGVAYVLEPGQLVRLSDVCWFQLESIEDDRAP